MIPLGPPNASARMAVVILLDGKATRDEIFADLTTRVAALRERGIVPGLGTILVGDDPGSATYVRLKHSDCAKVGITSIRKDLPADATQEQLNDAIDELNADPACTGYLIQLPLPRHLDENEALERVDPEKDADGLHPVNLGRLVIGKEAPLPCTPRGVVALLRRFEVPIAGAHVVIVGRGPTVGRPLGLILTRRTENATVTLCHTGTRDLAAEVRRADIVVARTATAHAAWAGRAVVTAADVRVAAELALPHRRRRDPFDEPGLDPQDLDDALTDPPAPQQDSATDDDSSDTGDTSAGADAPDGGPRDDVRNGDDGPDGDGPNGGPDGGGAAPGPRPGFPPGHHTATPARRIEVPGVGEGAPGRRSRAQGRHGRVVRPTSEPRTGLHLLGTVFTAAPHQVSRGRTHGPLRLQPRDLRGAHREGREGNLVVFVVDASGSMAARARLTAVTGAVVALLRDAYQRRDKVAVITLRGTEATVALPPTSSVDIAVKRLSGLRTGGKTPLAEGFLRARELVLRERVRDPLRRALVVTLTDGKATGGIDPVHRARVAAGLLARECAAVVVDCETGMVRLGLAADIAKAGGAEYLRLAELTPDTVAGVAKAA